MIGLAPVTAPALHPNSPLHPLATHSKRVCTTNNNTAHAKETINWRSFQLCGLLSLTGNYEFLAKDSVITDLKQSIWGKVCFKKRKSWNYIVEPPGKQLGDWGSRDTRHSEHPLWHGWRPSGDPSKTVLHTLHILTVLHTFLIFSKSVRLLPYFVVKIILY